MLETDRRECRPIPQLAYLPNEYLEVRPNELGVYECIRSETVVCCSSGPVERDGSEGADLQSNVSAAGTACRSDISELSI